MKTTTAGITFATEGALCTVESPYYPAFVEAAKKKNGRWRAPHWVFDARDEEALRAECRRIYGTDGTPVPCVDVRVGLDVLGTYLSGPVWAALGRVLVERKARDYRAKLGEGVVVLEGGFPASGGSVKNPRPDPKDGTVIEVRDVPLELARRWAAEYEQITFEEPPVEAPPAHDPRAAAMDEIRRLMAEHGIAAEELARPSPEGGA